MPDLNAASGAESPSVGSRDGAGTCMVGGRAMLGLREEAGGWMGGGLMVTVVVVPEVVSVPTQEMSIRGRETVRGLTHLVRPRLDHRRDGSTPPLWPRAGTLYA